MQDHDFSVGFSSSALYAMAILPVVSGVALVVAGTRFEPAILFYALGAVVLLVGVALAYHAYATNHLALRVTPDGLIVQAPLRRRAIARSELGVARQVDLATDASFTPVRRKNGTDVAGLKEGWWELRNGEKALVVLTDPRNAVYIPTTAGYAVLVSPTDPAAFLASLKEARTNL
jgi:hypothetical protein